MVDLYFAVHMPRYALPNIKGNAQISYFLLIAII